MKIRMLTTERGSIDGFTISSYVAGADYDLTKTKGEIDLAAAFVVAGFAEAIPSSERPKTSSNTVDEALELSDRTGVRDLGGLKPMTVAQIKAALAAKNISIPDGVTLKPDLQALLDEHQ